MKRVAAQRKGSGGRAADGSERGRDARQADFAAALLDLERPIPAGLIGPDGRPSTRRFNVYRNNVVASLTRVLGAAFPVTVRIVGEEFFCGAGASLRRR